MLSFCYIDIYIYTDVSFMISLYGDISFCVVEHILHISISFLNLQPIGKTMEMVRNLVSKNDRLN